MTFKMTDGFVFLDELHENGTAQHKMSIEACGYAGVLALESIAVEYQRNDIISAEEIIRTCLKGGIET
jgi:hypothetical protein